MSGEDEASALRKLLHEAQAQLERRVELNLSETFTLCDLLEAAIRDQPTSIARPRWENCHALLDAHRRKLKGPPQ